MAPMDRTERSIVEVNIDQRNPDRRRAEARLVDKCPILMWRHDSTWMGLFYNKARRDHLAVVHHGPKRASHHFDQFIHDPPNVFRVGVIHAVVERCAYAPAIL